MQPTLRPGDRIVVWQWFTRVRPGDLVAFVEPDRRTVGIKRVAHVNADNTLDVRGQNVNVSRDSREFGPVPRRLILGRAIYRYWPGTRRGRL